MVRPKNKKKYFERVWDLNKKKQFKKNHFLFNKRQNKTKIVGQRNHVP